MPVLYFTAASVGYLIQTSFALAIAGYLWHLRRRLKAGAGPLGWLAGAVTAFAVVTGLLLLNASLDSNWRYFVIPLESIAVAFYLLFLLQFAYHFPAPAPGQGWEARLALGLSGLYLLLEGNWALARYVALAQGQVRYRPPFADYPLVIAYVWVALVFFRQAARNAPAESGWRKFWRLGNRAAGAAAAFGWLALAMFALEITEVLRARNWISTDLTDVIQSIGVLFVLSALALAYLHYLPERSSFMAKLVGICMAVLLAVLGGVGWAISPAYTAAYHDQAFISDRQTVRFTPNAAGGYTVAQADFRFDEALGQPIRRDQEQFDLGFDFPFYGRTWRQIYILEDGAVSFNQALNMNDAKYHYGPWPAIFALAMDLDLASKGGGLYLRQQPDQLTITWLQLHPTWDDQARYTFQLSLYPQGVFEITYNGLPARWTSASEDPEEAPWLIGAVPGAAAGAPQSVDFTLQLPYAGGPAGLVQDYYPGFRRYLNALFAPLAALVVISSLASLFGLPIFFRVNLVNPLNQLLGGIRRVDDGQLDAAIPVQYMDEIGFLTQAFNAMAAGLQQRTQTLSRRTAELEALARLSSALSEAVFVQEMLPVLLAETVAVLKAESGFFLLLEGHSLVLAAQHGTPARALGQRLPLAEVACWRENQPAVWIAPAAADSACAACQLNRRLDLAVSQHLVIPLQAGKQSLGLLHLILPLDVQLSEANRRLLTAITEIGGNALQRARVMETLEQLVRDRTRDLTVLFEVASATTQSSDIQGALEQVLEKTLESRPGAAGLIHLLHEDEAGRRLRLRAQRGLPPHALAAQPAAAGPWSLVVERDEVVLQPEQQWEAWPPGLDYLGAPIHARGRLLGVLSIVGGERRGFLGEEIILLKGIADHLGAAVESARLRRQESELAVREERRRLARDLHDSATQSIHSLVLSADTARHLLKHRRLEMLDDVVGRLGNSARQALRELRLLLFELRLTSKAQMNLVESLQTRLEMVEKRAGMRADLLVAKTAEWPKAWESELYYIAIEALNNTLRHAHATQVTVSLTGADGQLELLIADDGGGFIPLAASSGGLGLTNMLERAHKLGGHLEIDSQPAAGVRVRFWASLRPDAEEAGR